MFNLIPDNLKDEIKSEYKIRRMIFIVFFIILIEMSFLAFIFPSWLISISKEKDLLSATEKMNEATTTSSTDSVQGTIKALNIKLGIVDTALQYPKVVPFVNAVLSKKTDSIFISKLAFTSNSPNTATMSIQGVSSTRESLDSFFNSIKSSTSFKTADLPISNFAKSRDIDFTISTTIELP